MRVIILLAICLLPVNGRSQTFDWWAQLVQWDGVTHWSRYMITAPAYQGPNSLPVPRIGNGSIDSSFSISLTGNLHFSKGDNTQNLALYANYCLVKDVIAFDLSWVPYEHFTLSHAIKEKRHVYSHFYYDRSATGDIYLNTTIQLLNKLRPHFNMALRAGYRFPAGSGLPTARYTDGPGYHFDLSFGKPFAHAVCKWIGMLGFYSWQIISDSHRQNDAFLFGTGAEWNAKSLRMQTYIAGYLGYLDNGGDKLILFRTAWEKKLKRSSLLVAFQQGLSDFEYSSLEIGLKYFLQ